MDTREREALQSLALAGDDLADMAPHFIAAKDERGLRNWGTNVASIARAALAAGPDGDAPAALQVAYNHGWADAEKHYGVDLTTPGVAPSVAGEAPREPSAPEEWPQGLQVIDLMAAFLAEEHGTVHAPGERRDLCPKCQGAAPPPEETRDVDTPEHRREGDTPVRGA